MYKKPNFLLNNLQSEEKYTNIVYSRNYTGAHNNAQKSYDLSLKEIGTHTTPSTHTLPTPSTKQSIHTPYTLHTRYTYRDHSSTLLIYVLISIYADITVLNSINYDREGNNKPNLQAEDKRISESAFPK